MDLVTLATLCALGAGAPRCTAWRAADAHPLLIAATGRDEASGAQNHPGTPPNPPPALARWESYISAAARRFGMLERWVRAVMLAESGGRTMRDGQPITSRAGAMGLMQVMPETYAEMRARLGLGDDPYDPHDNIFAGVGYLRRMYDRYDYPGFFAAYNAGPERYDAYLRHGRTLPDETWRYLAALGSDVREIVETQGGSPHELRVNGSPLASNLAAPTSERKLFFKLGHDVATPLDPSSGARAGLLFVPLGTRLGVAPQTEGSGK